MRDGILKKLYFLAAPMTMEDQIYIMLLSTKLL